MEANVSVVPIPGPCAFVAALSASGLSTTEFSFGNFASKTGVNFYALYVSATVQIILNMLCSWFSSQKCKWKKRETDGFG